MGSQWGNHAGGTSQHNPFMKFAPVEWNPIFSTRRKDVHYKRENERLIDIRDLESEDSEEGGLVRSFMKDYDESESCLPQSDMVQEYCFGVSLKGLQGRDKGVRDTIALLDVRGKVGEEDRARKYQGPLTAQGLYEELLKPSYRYVESSGSSCSSREGSIDITDGARYQPYPSSDRDSDSESDYSKESFRLDVDLEKYDSKQAPEPNAERKKIFITNLDRWAMYALMVTASESQARALRDAIPLHLKFEPFIGVTLPSAGLPMYHLAFHIPFYAWRMSKHALKDSRLNQEQKPLRKSQDVSFLNWSSTGCSDFLYEAQYSGVVAGTDEMHWVAYGFFDTYFDGDAETRETVEGYHDDSLGEYGTLVDPLAFGAFEAEKAIPTAREYWLCVFRIRIHHVVREWEQVVKKLGQSISEYYEQTYIFDSRLSGSYKADKDFDERIRKSRDWVVLVETLTDKLIEKLSKTVEACENFCQHHAVCFQNLSESAHGHRSCPAIQRSFDRLESLRKDLRCLGERCAGFAKQLTLVITFENKKKSDSQHKLSLIMMVTIPFALATQFFSMQLNFIPSIAMNSGVFGFISLVSIIATIGFFFYVGLEIPTFQWAGCHGSRWATVTVKVLIAKARRRLRTQPEKQNAPEP